MVEHIQLKRDDNDNAKTWGGKTLDITPNYTVKELQSDLKSVGTYTMTENGVFGPKTERALKLFQWVSINMTHCLKSKKYSSRIKSSNILTSGILDQSTYTELANWIEADKEVTGDLIRIDFSDLSNCEASPNFKKTSSSKILKNEMVISKSALVLVSAHPEIDNSLINKGN
jgi:hypothetical protein